MDVHGTIRVARQDSVSSGGEIVFARASDNTNTWAVDVEGNDFRVYDASQSSTRIHIGSGGNVGLGSTATSRLHVFGDAIVTGIITASVINDSIGSVRIIPQNSQTTSYQLQNTDAGKHISITTGGVTVPSGVFSTGDVVSIYNNSGSNQTITQGATVTLRQAGTANTGNRTLSQYGLATILCVASNTFAISGAGLT